MKQLLSQINDKKVCKEVIDFFNQNLFYNKPYKIRTITALYAKEGELSIYEDEDRYFIDSPFRDYYPLLSSYIAKYHLDDVFLDGNKKPRKGFFYFEYYFDTEDKTIKLIDFDSDSISEQLHSATLRNTYPKIVHSMVNDYSYLNWDDIKVSVQKEKSEYTEKILYIFENEVILRDTHYSIFITFKIDKTSNIAYNILRKEISNEYLSAIRNTTKGISYDILASKLKNLQTFQREVNNFSHSIFNMLPDIWLGIQDIRDDIKLIDSNLYERLYSEEKRIQLVNMFFQVIGGREVKEIKDQSIIGILQILAKLDVHRVKPIFHISPDSSSFDYIPKGQEEANNSLNVLWNFWYNAAKYTASGIQNFDIRINTQDDHLLITFENISKNDGNYQNCLYLLDKVDTPNSIRGENGGIAISKRKAKDLGWEFIEATVIQDKDNQHLWHNYIKIQV